MKFSIVLIAVLISIHANGQQNTLSNLRFGLGLDICHDSIGPSSNRIRINFENTTKQQSVLKNEICDLIHQLKNLPKDSTFASTKRYQHRYTSVAEWRTEYDGESSTTIQYYGGDKGVKMESLMTPDTELISYGGTYLLVINRYAYHGNSRTIAETVYFFERKK